MKEYFGPHNVVGSAVTPRIDRPQAFGKAKAIQAQLQASGAGLAPMLEDEREGEDPDELPEAAREKASVLSPCSSHV